LFPYAKDCHLFSPLIVSLWVAICFYETSSLISI
jgi:hypothetical protein